MKSNHALSLVALACLASVAMPSFAQDAGSLTAVCRLAGIGLEAGFFDLGKSDFTATAR